MDYNGSDLKNLKNNQTDNQYEIQFHDLIVMLEINKKSWKMIHGPSL